MSANGAALNIDGLAIIAVAIINSAVKRTPAAAARAGKTALTSRTGNMNRASRYRLGPDASRTATAFMAWAKTNAPASKTSGRRTYGNRVWAAKNAATAHNGGARICGPSDGTHRAIATTMPVVAISSDRRTRRPMSSNRAPASRAAGVGLMCYK